MRRINTKELKKAMIDADYTTLTALSSASEIDMTSLSLITRGERIPSWDTMVALSDALHLTYEGIGRIFFYSEVTDT